MSGARVRQSGRSQFADIALLLVLLFVTLFATTWIVERTTAEDAGSSARQTRQIHELPISADEKRQYRSMVHEGLVDKKTANQQVADNAPSEDKYPIEPLTLLATVLLLVGYLAFVYRVSFKEYREVIDHKFGKRGVG
ncbi:hypothetical protein HCC61_08140 [Streptomyces sp. HNM0575]|uniref:hypothetical protein n=1 Tax=Streptomyces sp. HNM0575 TaxID=2716338 RepID=UPI00145CC694|nr:hypothetical protein [Streptomyces sp. HNM0575]NLU72641.1 hypothetical protein [Streptomyces sp. HNM0575]